jgi:class III poly(R)-hydroxyalkanoic acid synthase PhaE subunit
MDPLQYMQSLAELWSRGGGAMLAAQQKMMRAMADRAATTGESRKAYESPQADAASWERLNASGETFAKLWSSALEMSAKISRAATGDRAVDPLLQDMLGKILDPRAWFSASNDLSQSLDRFAEGPRLADLWENERRLLAVLNAWLALRKAGLDHNTVLLDGWMLAAGAFARRLNEKADEGEALESWRQVLALWVDVANDAMLQTQRTDRFLESQRELLSAASELRLAQQELAQYYSEMFGFPTRDEIDDVHKAVTELRRELRALKRDRKAQGPRTDGAARVPRPRGTTKKKAVHRS